MCSAVYGTFCGAVPCPVGCTIKEVVISNAGRIDGSLKDARKVVEIALEMVAIIYGRVKE